MINCKNKNDKKCTDNKKTLLTFDVKTNVRLRKSD